MKKNFNKKKKNNMSQKNKEESIEVEGVVTKLMPNANFTVKLKNGSEVLAHISGRMRMNFIQILEGDRVKMEISPYDLTKGRITFRYKD